VEGISGVVEDGILLVCLATRRGSVGLETSLRGTWNTARRRICTKRHPNRQCRWHTVLSDRAVEAPPRPERAPGPGLWNGCRSTLWIRVERARPWVHAHTSRRSSTGH